MGAGGCEPGEPASAGIAVQQEGVNGQICGEGLHPRGPKATYLQMPLMHQLRVPHRVQQ